MSDQVANSRNRMPFSEEELDFIIHNYMDMTDPEIAEVLGRTHYSIKTQRHKMGMFKHHHEADWTDEEIEIFKEHYPTTPNDEMLKLLPGRTIGSLYKKTQDLGIKKTKKFLLAQNRKLGEKLGELGKGHRFKKGHTPFNAGKNQEEYMSREAIERSKKTRFKKGQKSHTELYDGAITIRKDSSGGQYMYIRMDKSEWMLYSRYQWEKHFGPIPEDHIVTYKDGDSLNCAPDNLELISRSEHARRNHNWEKARETIEARGGFASERLTDNYVAGILSGGDKELKEHLINERQDLIRVARANYKLKRELKNAS